MSAGSNPAGGTPKALAKAPCRPGSTSDQPGCRLPPGCDSKRHDLTPSATHTRPKGRQPGDDLLSATPSRVRQGARRAVRPQPYLSRGAGITEEKRRTARGPAGGQVRDCGGGPATRERQPGPLPLRWKCPARATAAAWVPPHPPGTQAPPPRSWVTNPCQSGRAVLLAPGILSPRKITVKVVRPRCAAGVDRDPPAKTRHLSGGRTENRGHQPRPINRLTKQRGTVRFGV